MASRLRQAGYIDSVKDVSIDVHKGEKLVIMGLSGSGRSTLVRCFSRLRDITGGTISAEGQDIMSLPERDLIELRRSKMGMIFQSFRLPAAPRGSRQCCLPAENARPGQTHPTRALEVITLVGLEGREGNFPRELSGGQMLRHVYLPSARTEILVGVDQVIMLSLAMVVLTAFIGMPELGARLLSMTGSFKLGRSLEIGITIVLLAVMPDRLSKAWVVKQPVHREKGKSWLEWHTLWHCPWWHSPDASSWPSLCQWPQSLGGVKTSAKAASWIATLKMTCCKTRCSRL